VNARPGTDAAGYRRRRAHGDHVALAVYACIGTAGLNQQFTKVRNARSFLELRCGNDRQRKLFLERLVGIALKERESLLDQWMLVHGGNDGCCAFGYDNLAM